MKNFDIWKRIAILDESRVQLRKPKQKGRSNVEIKCKAIRTITVDKNENGKLKSFL